VVSLGHRIKGIFAFSFLNDIITLLVYNTAISTIRRIWGNNMDTQNEKHRKSTILYDAGCGCISILLGAAFLGAVALRGQQINIIPTILYDAGFWFLIPMFVGGVFLGVVIDYFWNYLILYLALRWQKISITIKRRFAYTAIITAVGLLIDWLYYQFTWGTQVVVGSLGVSALFEGPGLNPGLELGTILIPMALIGAVNYFGSRFHLHLEKKHALVVGLAMAVFTAPWLIVAFVLSGR
jgi:hypothetical protein